MATIRIWLLLVALLVVGNATAQKTIDSKQIQVATEQLRIGTDTAKYFTAIKTVINALSTHHDAPTAKAVYDFLNTFRVVARSSTFPHAVKIKLSNTNTGGVDITGTDGVVIDSITGSRIQIRLQDVSISTGKLAESGATAGQILRWSGTEWVPSSASNPYVFVIANSSISAAVNTVLIGTLSAAITLGLPTCNATNDAKTFQFQKNGSDTYSVTIDPNGSETFYDGASTKIIYSSGSGLLCTCRFSGGTGSWFFTN